MEGFKLIFNRSKKSANFCPVNWTKYLALQPILLGSELT
jgi:hypothetical protein